MRQVLVTILVFVIALGGAVVPALPAVAAVAPCCVAHGHVPQPAVAPTCCCCGGDGSCCALVPSAPANPASKDEKAPPPEQPTRVTLMPLAAFVVAVPASDAATTAPAGTLVETPGLSTCHAGIRRHLELSILRD